MRCCFARNQSSDLNGSRRIFLVATLEILEEIFLKNGRGPEIIMDPRRTRRARMVNVSRKISFELYSCCLFHRSRW